MAQAISSRGVREGSVVKRDAILQAARELFVSDGVERTSVDAVALRAKVSKRTVYDYYGDKHNLVLAVIEHVGQSLLDSIEAASRAHLSDDAAIVDVDALEKALVSFVNEVSTSTIESSDYTAFMKLVTTDGSQLPELADHRFYDAPEGVLGERLAHFAQMGLLAVPAPRTAADHFIALSFGLVHNTQGVLGGARPSDVQQTIVDGVQAFLRAYAPR